MNISIPYLLLKCLHDGCLVGQFLTKLAYRRVRFFLYFFAFFSDYIFGSFSTINWMKDCLALRPGGMTRTFATPILGWSTGQPVHIISKFYIHVLTIIQSGVWWILWELTLFSRQDWIIIVCFLFVCLFVLCISLLFGWFWSKSLTHVVFLAVVLWARDRILVVHVLVSPETVTVNLK